MPLNRHDDKPNQIRKIVTINIELCSMGVVSNKLLLQTTGTKWKDNSYRKVNHALAKFSRYKHRLMRTRFSRHTPRVFWALVFCFSQTIPLWKKSTLVSLCKSVQNYFDWFENKNQTTWCAMFQTCANKLSNKRLLNCSFVKRSWYFEKLNNVLHFPNLKTYKIFPHLHSKRVSYKNADNFCRIEQNVTSFSVAD